LSAAIERTRATGHRHQTEHLVEYRGWGHAANTRRGGNNETMAQGGLHERLDIVGRHIIAPFQCGVCLGAAEERQRSARAGAEIDMLMLPRGGHQRNDILANLLVDPYLPYLPLHRSQLIGSQDLAERVNRVNALLAVEDGYLIGGSRISQADIEHKAVELRLG